MPETYKDAFQTLRPPHPLWPVALQKWDSPREWNLGFSFSSDARIHIPYLSLSLKSANNTVLCLWGLSLHLHWAAAVGLGGTRRKVDIRPRQNLPVVCRWWRYIISWCFLLLWSVSVSLPSFSFLHPAHGLMAKIIILLHSIIFYYCGVLHNSLSSSASMGIFLGLISKFDDYCSPFFLEKPLMKIINRISVTKYIYP